MLNDRPRNESIVRAIEALSLEGKTVVEIGTGTGLIALLFARAGAKKVFTCEMNPKLAAVAHDVVQSTEYADRITIIDRSSRQAIEDGLLPEAPDVIFTETLDCGVVGEAFFDIAHDIKQLAAPHTIVLPGEVRQIGMLIESQQIAELNSVDDVCGFDLSRLNAYSTATYYPIREELYDYSRLSEVVLLRRYNYMSDNPTPSIITTATGNGTVNGIMTWMEIQLGNEVFSNAPGTPSHWHKAFHPLETPMTVKKGDELEIAIANDGKVGIGSVALPVPDQELVAS